MTAIRTNADLIAAVRTRKAELGLADGYFEEKAGLTQGAYCKYFGDFPVKFMSTNRLFDVAGFLGLELMLAVNPDYNPKAVNEWKRGDARQRRPAHRKKVRSARVLGRAGGLKRAGNLAPSSRQEIARKGGKASGKARLAQARARRARLKAAVREQPVQRSGS
jgi:general stress protein YciG